MVQRMKLGRVAPALLGLYRSGEMPEPLRIVTLDADDSATPVAVAA